MLRTNYILILTTIYIHVLVNKNGVIIMDVITLLQWVYPKHASTVCIMLMQFQLQV